MIVRAPLWLARLHRQDGLGAVPGLDLAFFLPTKHAGPGLFGRVEGKPDDGAHFLHEERVGGELEVFLPVGLEAAGLPDTLGRFAGKTPLAGQQPSAPLRGLFGFLFQGLGDDRFHWPIRDLAGSAAAGHIGQPHQALGHKAPAPLAHHGAAHPQRPGDRLVVQTPRTA